VTYDHRSTDLRRADLDREIDTIRFERIAAARDADHRGLLERARRGAGRALIAAGGALIGRETARLGSPRA
jgi:hypothetical protein